MERARRVEVTVGRAIELSGVPLQRMRTELLDVQGDRGGEALRPEGIEAHRAAVGIQAQGQSVPGARLVAGDQWLRVLNRGRGSREDSDPRLCHHSPIAFPLGL